jgi:MFS family permease
MRRCTFAGPRTSVVPAERRGWWSGLLYSGIYFGIALGAIVGGNVAPIIGWRWTFALSGIPVLVAVYVRFSTPESDLWASKRRAAKTNWSLILNRAFLGPFVLCLVAASSPTTASLRSCRRSWYSRGFHLGPRRGGCFFPPGLVGSIAGAYTNDQWGRRVTLTYLAGSAALGGLILFFSWPHLLTSPLILIPFFILYFGSNGATVFGALFSEQFPTRSTGVSAALQIARGLSSIPPIITAVISRYMATRQSSWRVRSCSGCWRCGRSCSTKRAARTCTRSTLRHPLWPVGPLGPGPDIVHLIAAPATSFERRPAVAPPVPWCRGAAVPTTSASLRR